MTRQALSFSVVAALWAIPLCSAPAVAGLPRTFVSGHGSDANPCTLAAPCRSFAQAITQTAAGGEISVLDSAGYGPVTISQSVTITNPGGVEAGITAGSGQNAITINAPTGAEVTLRGLTLLGGGVGANGILLNSALSGSNPLTLTVIGCALKNFANAGMAFEPSSSDSGAIRAFVTVTDTIAANNTLYGIQLKPLGGAPNVVLMIYNSTLVYNGSGLSIDTSGGGLNGQISDSHADLNATGINTTGGTLVIRNSTARYNTDSLFGTGVDITNRGNMFLFDHNNIGYLQNTTSATSDGTNNTSQLTGNALQKAAPQ